jgi:hypothetical protein
MADEARTAWELEQDARTINATDWQPLPGIAKKLQPVPLLVRCADRRSGGDIAVSRLRHVWLPR